ncbi:MAG: hypothetical protein U0T77_03505 [Chitinophagales bacterium]
MLHTTVLVAPLIRLCSAESFSIPDTSRYILRIIPFSVLFSYAYAFLSEESPYTHVSVLSGSDTKAHYKNFTIVCMVVMFGLMFSGFEFLLSAEIFCTRFAVFMLYLIKDGKNTKY